MGGGGCHLYGGRPCHDGSCCGGLYPGGCGSAGESHGSFLGVEDRAALAERGAQERVSRMETENAAMLTSSRGEAEGFTQRIVGLCIFCTGK
jgi:hypothetical protein